MNIALTSFGKALTFLGQLTNIVTNLGKALTFLGQFKLKQFVSVLIAISVLCVPLFFVWKVFPHQLSTTYTTAEVRNIIVSGVRNVSDLVTAETTGKATVVIKEVAKILNIPVGNTNLVYEGVGTVASGINPKEIQILAVDNEEKTVKLLIPAPKIYPVRFEVERSQTIANYRQWFGPKAGPELYDTAQRKAIAEIRQQACANHILDAASQNAASLVTEILTKVNLKTVEVEFQAMPTDTCPMI